MDGPTRTRGTPPEDCSGETREFNVVVDYTRTASQTAVHGADEADPFDERIL